ncbi:MAG: hypothetical protein H0T60_00660 [Acidobacteria bacterium]|nr:hypothetical protein [Acidobacteriota bacterium]
MRWKLLIIASTLAALVGAGASLAAAHFLFGAAAGRFATPDWAVASTLLLPLAATTYATIFVYRHTSRRRALQSAATALLALLLMLTALLTVSIFFGKTSPGPDPAPPQPVAMN